MLTINNSVRRQVQPFAHYRAGTRSGGLFVFISLLLLGSPSSFGQAAGAHTPQSTTATAPALAAALEASLPKTWVDPDTNRRVTRLTDEPRSEGLYFDVNPYTPDGNDMIYTSMKGIYDMNMSTLKSDLLVHGMLRNVVVGTKTRRVFYKRAGDASVYMVDIDSKATKKIATLPARGIISSINADETLLVGTFLEGTAPDYEQYEANVLAETRREWDASHTGEQTSRLEAPAAKQSSAKERAMEARFAAHSPEDMFTVNLRTGEVTVILKGTDWLNHVQFSPTDPNLIMYAHEGSGLGLDRIWTIRADGTQNKKIRERTSNRERVTHEFWSRDGKTIWYDLQMDLGHEFGVAGYNVATGDTTLFYLKRSEASLHFNSSSDNTAFCGDGEASKYGNNTQWIEVLYPKELTNHSKVINSKVVGPPYTGWLHNEHLVNMGKNDYSRVEPNVHFSPDHKLVIFTSNMQGPTNIYAVEVNPTTAEPSVQGKNGN